MKFLKNRTIKRVKITFIPSIDFIPYLGAYNSCMSEYFFLCFRFNFYYPLNEDIAVKTEDEIFS